DIELCNGNQELNDLDLNSVQKWAAGYGVNLWSYHLPFAPNTDICIERKETEKHTVDLLSEQIRAAGSIGIDKFIIHPSSEPISDEERPECMKRSKDNLYKLSEVCESCGVTLAVEDLPRTCLGRNSDEILELIGVHPNMRVCFDTNHLLKEDVTDFVRKVGKKIVTLHVSDFDFINERHWMPGEGDVDWQALYSALNGIGYSGSWLYEVDLDPPKTINRRMLTVKDFADNANEIFAGKAPVAIGKRKERLGMWGVIKD
ncbi:MAG: sugar phosphate isomerase/epimerase, partial [Clostridia bacterium]|nr:sugar phosphate isomerase/epimerase [Clostridia bacterium]